MNIGIKTQTEPAEKDPVHSGMKYIIKKMGARTILNTVIFVGKFITRDYS
jgi:hypothetical protein